MSQERPFRLHNGSGAMLTVVLEPLAEDVTLRPYETLNFVPISPGPDFYFQLSIGEPGFATLYAEGQDEGVDVTTESGAEVVCGYQRELSPSKFLRKHVPPKPT